MEEVVVDTRDLVSILRGKMFFYDRLSFYTLELSTRNFHRYMASLSIISGEAARFDAGIY